MCERHMKLTFHYLIPKELHSRYMKKNRLPVNLKTDRDFKMVPFLRQFGIYVCRHSAIHRCEPNKVLAEDYNNLGEVG